MSISSYVFTGVFPFVQRAALARGVEATHIGRSNETWYVKRIQESIGSMWRRDWSGGATVCQDRVTQEDLLRQIGQYRQCLASTLDGIDAAILEVVTHLDLPIPAYLEGSNHRTRHMGGTDDPGVGPKLDRIPDGGPQEGHRQISGGQHGQGKPDRPGNRR